MTRDWFYEALDSKNPIITEPYTDLTTNSLVTSIAYAVRDEKEKPLGVCAIDILLSELIPFVQGKTFTKDGQSFLINKDGMYLTNSNFDKILNDNFFDEYKSLSSYKDKILEGDLIESKAKDGYYKEHLLLLRHLAEQCTAYGASATEYYIEFMLSHYYCLW